uniref:Uncharacterized protein n=1 Tax=Solanum lycopersicum TaxID=4081 RepID=A0A3Q7F8E8_SOLLC
MCCETINKLSQKGSQGLEMRHDFYSHNLSHSLQAKQSKTCYWVPLATAVMMKKWGYRRDQQGTCPVVSMDIEQISQTKTIRLLNSVCPKAKSQSEGGRIKVANL